MTTCMARPLIADNRKEETGSRAPFRGKAP